MELSTLNDRQKEAVLTTEGALLILAGAGSGKTRVLIHRIAYLIEEKGVYPWNILAVTFTNKAANEMRERVDKIVGSAGEQVWVATFHSTCVRILRRYIDCIGYENNFTIYDTDDQKAVMSKLFKERNINTKMFKERAVLSFISSCKNEFITYEEALKRANNVNDMREKEYAKLYKAYDENLYRNNALDFDDLILKTVELFEKEQTVLDYYQERFKYIMIDEYQDTNPVQFRLIELLSQKYGNICVVGDDDQSIYKFRGATIENILGFENVFEGTKVIKLEQNYRSIENILDVANSVIQNNYHRKDKKLWTEKRGGEKVTINCYHSAKDEAIATVKDILSKAKVNKNYNDFAILYRTNAQSRLLEEQCVIYDIPYRLIGGINFYQRKEIKDILAYIKTIVNGRDDIAFLRVINTPKRGIGNVSLNKVSEYAVEQGISLLRASAEMAYTSFKGNVAKKFSDFTDMIYSYRNEVQKGITAFELIEKILDEIKYEEYLLNEETEDEVKARMENIKELMNKAKEYDDLGIDKFLEDVALIADIDSLDQADNRVTLMTLHSAKGLEFPNVYLTGMEEGLFPSNMSMSEEQGVEEERRLCYVGITRTKDRLTLSYSLSRTLFGEYRGANPSRFLKEIPKELYNSKTGLKTFKSLYSDEDSNGFDFEVSKKNVIKKDTNILNYGKEFKVEKPNSLDYEVGDRVKHVKFGEGTILSIVDGKKDYEISIDFDEYGIKKVFSTFAKLIKL
jgi:superfamily I DNA and RNA helicases